MDRDSKLIFESYKNKTVNEALQVGVGVVGGMLTAPLLSYLAAEFGITRTVLNTLKRLGIDVEYILDLPVINLVKYLEPSGLTNWPDVDKLNRIYDENPTDENLWNLIEALFYTIPIVGKYSAGVKFLAKGSSELGFFYRLGIAVVRWTVIQPLLKIPAVRLAFYKAIVKSGKPVIRMVNSILGVAAMRFLGIQVAADGSIELLENAPEELKELWKKAKEKLGSRPSSKTVVPPSTGISPVSPQPKTNSVTPVLPPASTNSVLPQGILKFK